MAWGPEQWDAFTLERSVAGAHAPAAEAEAVRTFLDELPGRRRMTVADLGCGKGDWLPFLARRFSEVVAVDYAPATLAEARRVHAGLGVTFRRRDLRDLTPFRRRFDVALLIDALVGLPIGDVDRVLAEVHACLVEGGLLVASVAASPRRGRPVPMRLAGDHLDLVPLRFAEVEAQYRLRRAGFQSTRLRRFPGNETQPDVLLAIAARRASN